MKRLLRIAKAYFFQWWFCLRNFPNYAPGTIKVEGRVVSVVAGEPWEHGFKVVKVFYVDFLAGA